MKWYFNIGVAAWWHTRTNIKKTSSAVICEQMHRNDNLLGKLRRQ